MITTRVVRDLGDTKDLCETYSIEGYKLLQQDTGITYGSSVIDSIEGFENDLPYSKHTYIETDQPDTDREEEGDDDQPMMSSRNIPQDQYFTVGDRLFYSTASIASGDDIQVGINCEETALPDALNKLNKEN